MGREDYRPVRVDPVEIIEGDTSWGEPQRRKRRRQRPRWDTTLPRRGFLKLVGSGIIGGATTLGGEHLVYNPVKEGMTADHNPFGRPVLITKTVYQGKEINVFIEIPVRFPIIVSSFKKSDTLLRPTANNYSAGFLEEQQKHEGDILVIRNKLALSKTEKTGIPGINQGEVDTIERTWHKPESIVPKTVILIAGEAYTTQGQENVNGTAPVFFPKEEKYVIVGTYGVYGALTIGNSYATPEGQPSETPYYVPFPFIALK